MTKHEISINSYEQWNTSSRTMSMLYQALCTCGYRGRDWWEPRSATQDGNRHVAEAEKVDPDLTIYDVLLELIEMQGWGSEAIKQRRVNAVLNAKDNKVFGIEGSYKL